MSAHTSTRPPVQASAADPPSPAPRRPRRNQLWFFLVPAVALYTFVVLVPSGRGALLAFTDWDGLSPDRAWIGFDNFTAILDDADARAAVGQTLLVAVAITIVQNAVGLLLALGVNARIKSRNVLRVFLFAPAVMTPVVVGALWKNLLAPDGAVNWALDGIGLSSLKQDWLGDPDVAIWSVVGVVVWQFAGYSMVIFLAGLQGIPQDVYEAAEVDGAGPVRRFRHVIFPLLAPATTINLMLSIIGGLKLFDQVWVMTGGGPGHSSETLSTLIYKDAFQFGEFAYSIALAVILTIFVAIISSGQYWLLRRQEESSR
ncbi:sugar ABC transporter permease [Cryptosporangium japonicum]|uniref:Sugar ABC transporter permease n=1 Tax=Cryptosporangium japonicum TaxID=80872 RepID=A0ABN0V8B5_9ACTN